MPTGIGQQKRFILCPGGTAVRTLIEVYMYTFLRGITILPWLFTPRGFVCYIQLRSADNELF